MDIDYTLAADKLWAKVDTSDVQGCWPWLGQVDRYGYGRFSATIGPNLILRVRPHRLAYLLTYGDLDPSLDIDHMCHNVSPCDLGADCPHRRCCQPLHLFAETRQDHMAITRGNSASALNAVKTTCPQGHSYDRINNRGQRYCSTCTRERAARNHAKRRAAKGLPVYSKPGSPSPKNIKQRTAQEEADFRNDDGRGVPGPDGKRRFVTPAEVEAERAIARRVIR